MAKARYYGVATAEQRELKTRATRSPKLNKQELTAYSIYSAMAQIPNIDRLSVQVAAQRIKSVIMASGFVGDITTSGGKLSDGVNTFSLTKSSEHGIHIGKQEHDDMKRYKR